MEASTRQYRLENSILSPHLRSSTATASPRTQPPRQLSPRPIARSEPDNPYPTTFVQADPSTFKQVVQMLTGSSPRPDRTPAKPHHSIPPIKTAITRKPQPGSGSGSGFRLYDRRNSIKKLSLSPLIGFVVHPCPGLSPRKPDILSPSVLDFPSLTLSPVTPLMPDPFAPALDMEAEERAIKEKGFFLHPSPRGFPVTPEPRLLPLFPVTAPICRGQVECNEIGLNN